MNSKSLHLKQCLYLIILLSTVDAIFTMTWVELGIASEANPLMDVLMSTSYVLFVATKIGATYFGVSILYKYRNKRLAASATISITVLYCYVIVYHIAGFISYLLGYL